jgi:hypothetical protein
MPSDGGGGREERQRLAMGPELYGILLVIVCPLFGLFHV